MNRPTLATAPVTGWLRGVPLRVKLVTSVLSLVLTALLVISVSSAFFLRSYLVDQIDTDLRDYVVKLRDDVSKAQRLPVWDQPASVDAPLPTNYLVVVSYQDGPLGGPYYDDDRIATGELPRWPADWDGFAALQGEPKTVYARNGAPRWRMLYASLPTGDVIAVGQSLVDVDRAVSRLVWIDILVGIGVVTLLALAGAAIVRTNLRPLVEIEQTAAAIAAGDLSRRVPDPEPGAHVPQTELGRLSRTLNAMLTQIEAAFTARASSEWAARMAEASAREAAVAAQSSETRARRSEERMRQFVADASHELRTPLTTIRGFAELYRQGAAAASPQEAARLVRRIEDEAARMGLLVEDLLLLARLDRERPLDLAPVELPVLASDAVQAARAVDPQRRVELDIGPGAGRLVVLGDDARLRQVIGNLMTNAINHTPADTPVTLRLRATEPGFATVEVADEGPGLTPEQSERVFERFYRADAARTRSTERPTGTGLGLAIVAALVVAHSGTVEVHSEPGQGATFRVRLPLADTDLADTESIDDGES
ncbi:HAMP domain-containing sensor histidine kinase [Solwaraspora sp. WMMD792]|uniref:sensor histidine kinase n=1 Tax=Solwaraspora sp. WMMD792 TaxID=3016099 RepID=UPI002415F2B2|nr:HAMP domain-containing sensor histidine kinase [Solwaraspora sp. WMMD792]MDG4769286.1 HAMP domain-containing sensor histidine kinase [Solwaraspora sp. WMMD792]